MIQTIADYVFRYMLIHDMIYTIGIILYVEARIRGRHDTRI